MPCNGLVALDGATSFQTSFPDSEMGIMEYNELTHPTVTAGSHVR